MSPDQPPLPPRPPDANSVDPIIDATAGRSGDPSAEPPDAASEPASEHVHPGAAAFPPADSTPAGSMPNGSAPAEPRRADGARVWRVVRRPRWHERPDAHAPRRDVYYWLSTRRATSRASRPTSPDPHAR